MKNINNNDNSSKAVLYRFLCVIFVTKTQFEMCVELETNVLGS